jgi:hypothetical protein
VRSNSRWAGLLLDTGRAADALPHLEQAAKLLPACAARAGPDLAQRASRARRRAGAQQAQARASELAKRERQDRPRRRSCALRSKRRRRSRPRTGSTTRWRDSTRCCQRTRRSAGRRAARQGPVLAGAPERGRALDRAGGQAGARSRRLPVPLGAVRHVRGTRG